MGIMKETALLGSKRFCKLYVPINSHHPLPQTTILLLRSTMPFPYVWALPRALNMALSILQSIVFQRDIFSSNSTLACTDMSSNLAPGQVVWPSNILAYQREINAYYSQACSDLLPRCVVYPHNTSEVSFIVSGILTKYADVNIAVKSGGHNPNPGFNSVNGGVLISMSHMHMVGVSQDQTYVEVEPGARWGQVQEALDPINLTAVGGRMSTIVTLPFPTRACSFKLTTYPQNRRCWGGWISTWRRLQLSEPSVWVCYAWPDSDTWISS
jgi:hypothetical protein